MGSSCYNIYAGLNIVGIYILLSIADAVVRVEWVIVGIIFVVVAGI
jgi:hypothetical protein